MGEVQEKWRILGEKVDEYIRLRKGRVSAEELGVVLGYLMAKLGLFPETEEPVDVREWLREEWGIDSDSKVEVKEHRVELKPGEIKRVGDHLFEKTRDGKIIVYVVEER